MEKKKLYELLAMTIDARATCARLHNIEWLDKHEATIEKLARECLPSGSGIDSGCRINLDRSNGNRIIIDLGVHHMNSVGYYVGWTYHTITVIPDLASGFDLKISGRNYNDIKEYLYETFEYALNQEVCN